MLYQLPHQNNITPDSQVTFDFTAITDGTTETLSIDFGTISVNGIPSGQLANVNDLDVIVITVTANIAPLATEFIVVRQEGIVQGIASVTTISNLLDAVNLEVFDVEPYETLADDTWSPNSSDITVSELDLNLAKIGNETIVGVPTNNSSLLRLVLTDFHRDKVYFINPFTMEHFWTFDTYLGPVDSANLFNAGFRFLTAIAYKTSNKVVMYSDNIELDSIDSTEPIKLEVSGNILYVLEKGASAIRQFVFNESDNTYIESNIDFAEPIIDFIVTDQGISVLHLNKVIDFDSTAITVLDAYRFAYSDLLDSFCITLRSKKEFQLTDGELGLRTAKLKQVEPSYLGVPVIFDGGIFILGEIGSVRITGDTLTKVVESIPKPEMPTLGLAVIQGKLYGSRLYDDITPRLNAVDLTPNFLDLGAFEATVTGGFILSDIATLSGLDAPVNIKLQNVAELDIELYLNGVLVAAPIVATNGDTLQLKYTVADQYDTPLYIPLMVSDTAVIFHIEPKPRAPLPRETGFLNAVNTTVTQSVQLELLVDPILIAVDQGSLLRNGLPVGNSALYDVNDTISVVQEDLAANEIRYVTVNYDDGLHTSKVAFIKTENADNQFGLVDLGPVGTNIIDSNSIDRLADLQTVITSSEAMVVTAGHLNVDLTIPDIYNASIILNGINVGQTAIVNHGDKIAITLTTSANYKVLHQIPIVTLFGTAHYKVYTVQDEQVLPFNFGTLEDKVMTDYCESEIVTVRGLGIGVSTTFSIPAGTQMLKNGSPIYSDTYNAYLSEGNIDYRGVFVKDLPQANVSVTNGDTLQLVGYPRPTYGTLQSRRVRIGTTFGYWRIGTVVVEGVEDVINKLAVFSESAVAQVSFFRSAVEVDLRLAPLASSSYAPKKVDRSSSSKVDLTPVEYKVGITMGSKVNPSLPIITDVIPSSVTFENPSVATSYLVSSEVIHGATLLSPIGDSLYSTSSAAREVDNKTNSVYLTSGVAETNNARSYRVYENNLQPQSESSYGMFLYSTSSAPRNADFKTFATRSNYFEAHTIEHEQESVKFNSDWVAVGIGTLSDGSTVWDIGSYNLLDLEYKFIGRLPPKEFSMQFIILSPTSLSNLVKRDWIVPLSSDTAFMESNWIKHNTFSEVALKREWEKSFSSIALVAADMISQKYAPSKSAILTKTFIKPDVGLFETSANRDYSLTEALPSITVSKTYGINNPQSNNKAVALSSTHQKSSFNTFGSNGSILVVASDTTDLEQVWATEILAAENARNEYGLLEGSFTIIPYEDKFIWVRELPCENMCDACPKVGYIQGG